MEKPTNRMIRFSWFFGYEYWFIHLSSATLLRQNKVAFEHRTVLLVEHISVPLSPPTTTDFFLMKIMSRADFGKLSLVELREECRIRGARASGRKRELVER